MHNITKPSQSEEEKGTFSVVNDWTKTTNEAQNKENEKWQIKYNKWMKPQIQIEDEWEFLFP